MRGEVDAGEVDAKDLVRAAQEGDPAARERLAAEYLPLLYNVVGWAMRGHTDVDDVVQESFLRALDGLDGLRDPARFRSWLVSIAMNQVRRRWSAQQRGTPVDPETITRITPPEADFAELAVLRLELSGQRREIAEATRWLDDDERAVLSLWWLEASGHLARRELAEGLGLSSAHAAVRVQRMKEQLATCRTIVRALSADRRCPGLAALLTDWDGRPAPLWRKRIARHIRDCSTCSAHGRDLVRPEALLAGTVMVPPPEFSLKSFTAPADPAAAASGPRHWGRTAAASTAAVAVLAAVTIWAVQDPPPEPPSAAPTPPPSPTSPTSPTPAPTPAVAKDHLDRPEPTPPQSVQQQVVRLVNAERADAGCAPLRISPALQRAAREHTADMAARGVLDHRGAGGGPGERVTAAGVRWSKVAENIARGQGSPSAVVGSWMDSPGHRSNILDCGTALTGVALVRGSGGPWWTQVFAASR